MINNRSQCERPRGTHRPNENLPISTLAATTRFPTRDYFALPWIEDAHSGAAYSADLTAPSPALTCKLPSLDFTQAQAGGYWPGATTSTPITAAQALNTLPTPPTDNADAYKPGPGNRLAAGPGNEAGMTANIEPLGAMSSLTARRPAANNLPSMNLPAPSFGNSREHKLYPFHTASLSQSAQAPVGNLLTPPSNGPGDMLGPKPPSQAWSLPPTGMTPYGSGTGTTPQAWPMAQRGMFSPSLFSTLPRNNNADSPAAPEGLPPPPFDISQLPPFSAPASVSSSNTLPAITALQPHQQQVHAAFAQQNSLTHQLMQNHTQTQSHGQLSAATSQPSPVSAMEYAARLANPLMYYSASQPSSAQQSNFPPFNSHSSPVAQTPLSAPAHSARASPQSATFPTANPQYAYRQYNSYSLPAMTGPTSTLLNGPVMTNIHNPGNQMAMLGMPGHSMSNGMMHGYHSGHASQMYGSQQPSPINDRPFKCDQCPQSFNRNHDLKRHKRIHLAVKPFPCGHCDKSFSRKDALKVRSTVTRTTGGTFTDVSRSDISSSKVVARRSTTRTNGRRRWTRGVRVAITTIEPPRRQTSSPVHHPAHDAGCCFGAAIPFTYMY